MCTLGYPTEIQKLVDTFDPYREAISSKQFDRIPPEAVDAFNKTSNSTTMHTHRGFFMSQKERKAS